MSKGEDLYTAMHGRNEKEALAAFNRLLHANELSKDDALGLREHAQLPAIRNIASKFLGKMTPGKKQALGCLFSLVLLSGIPLAIISRVRSYSKALAQEDSRRQVQKVEQQQQKLNKLVSDMRAARKLGLAPGETFQDENTLPGYDEQIAQLHDFAKENAYRYFGTVQFGSRAVVTDPHELYLVCGTPTDPRSAGNFLLFTAEKKPLLNFSPQGYATNSSGRVIETYGDWNSNDDSSIRGNYLAKEGNGQLQIQIFGNTKGAMQYIGRVLLKTTK
jgi:hypothetical protein